MNAKFRTIAAPVSGLIAVTTVGLVVGLLAGSETHTHAAVSAPIPSTSIPSAHPTTKPTAHQASPAATHSATTHPAKPTSTHTASPASVVVVVHRPTTNPNSTWINGLCPRVGYMSQVVGAGWRVIPRTGSGTDSGYTTSDGDTIAVRGPIAWRPEVCAHEAAHAHEFSASQDRQDQANRYLANLLGVSVNTSSYRVMPTEVYAQSTAVCQGFGGEFDVPIHVVSCSTVDRFNRILAGTDQAANRTSDANLTKTNNAWLATLRRLASRGCSVDLTRGQERWSYCPLAVHNPPSAPQSLLNAGWAS